MITILLIWTNVRGSSRDWQMPQMKQSLDSSTPKQQILVSNHGGDKTQRKCQNIPTKRLFPTSSPSPRQVNVLLSCAGFGPGLQAPCERRVQLIVRWSRKATDSATVTQEETWQEGPLLCSSVQAEPSPWRGLLAALLCMGGHLLPGDNMTLELLLQRCSV